MVSDEESTCRGNGNYKYHYGLKQREHFSVDNKMVLCNHDFIGMQTEKRIYLMRNLFFLL